MNKDTRKTLAIKAARRTGFCSRDCQNVIKAFLDSSIDTLLAGGEIELRGFGSFRVTVTRKTRRRIPDTGDLVVVPSKRVIRFRVAESLLLRTQKGKDKAARVVSTQQLGR